MQDKIRLTLIYGSARPGRRCDHVADWTAAEIARHGGFALERLDPADPDIAKAINDHDREAGPALKSRIGASDAYIVVTPEYNRSFPAPLKAVIDSASAEWRAKPVAFVSYGGISGGLRAVEHLRGVFAELHAVGIRDGVSFANVWNQFDESGNLRDAQGARQALDKTLIHLSWWARTLNNGRQAEAYGEIAA
ncbi:MAG: NADPH-dependent FMN reductase [Rhodomicrobiaceae bacterium]